MRPSICWPQDISLGSSFYRMSRTGGGEMKMDLDFMAHQRIKQVTTRLVKVVFHRHFVVMIRQRLTKPRTKINFTVGAIKNQEEMVFLKVKIWRMVIQK